MQHLNILISHASVYEKAGWGRIFPLAVGLAKEGNNVTIITTNKNLSLFIKKITTNGVTIIVFPEIIPARISGLGFGLLSLCLKVLHATLHRYDVVHSDNGHRPLAGMPCRINKRIYGSIYAAEWYDWYGKGGQYDNKKRLFKILLGRYELKWEIKDKKIADGVIVLSEVLRLRAEQFKAKDKILKIHGGADVSRIPFLYDNSRLKEKYNINRNVLTLGYINSYSYNLAEFLPLINSIIKYDLSSKIKVLLFGESDSIRRQLSADLLDIIQFYGWIDFTLDYEKLQLVDAFFLFKEETQGNRAGWPNCIGDYLACGRPVMLNPVGELVEFVRKYQFAFLPTEREPDSIYTNIKYMLNNMEGMRENNKFIRKLAEDIVSWESKSKDLLKFYYYLIVNKQG